MFLKNIQNYFKVLWHCFIRHLWPACHLLKRIKKVCLLPISATFQTNKYTTGAHEIHVYEGEEADLHQEKVDCQKNPDHKNFIPIDQFTMLHLPEGHRDQDLYELIRAVADIAVKVDVKMVSPNRPKLWPNKKHNYPFYDFRERTVPRSGTGEVDKVIKFIGGKGFDHNGAKLQRDTASCPCEKCRDSDVPSTEWWEIHVDTAAHVVYDELEARHASCRLFYNTKQSPKVTFDKCSIHYSNVEGDWCVLSHVTCNQKVGSKMHRKFLRWVQLRDKVYNASRSWGNLAFIVSHPHGCPKQVSIGSWTDNKEVSSYKEYILSTLTYTTGTCQGSSGATIHCVGHFWDHLHSGTYHPGPNYSGTGLELRI
ncbi:uncharacterized protein LOC106070918 isoform X1 [Biomphalaria glabrata]|uniref:Uncharacterized protein LOC106070918 isoform X1 n=1 Tax=Biomphalaria glabrata TaxID=6526 RepID=A0A9W3A9J5_BIOGL|nr:uncharacterized protein LOC106070918 isoform X1 [Biomphalaria glabrata]XP_055883830.1 uncharacterized protein LOC106070918 isoform X1 [Biomphalaria glabrata]